MKAGSAYKKGKKTVYYGRVPKKCPKGGFPIKTEVIFDEGGADAAGAGARDGDLQGALPAQEVGH